MNRTIRFLLLFLIFLFGSLYAEDVAVFLHNLTNLSPPEGDAIHAVMVQQYKHISKKDVTGPREAQSALQDNDNDPKAAASSLGVSEYIVLNTVALETKILIEALLYDISGKELHRVQMTAISLDDLTEVCDRMSRALIHRIPTDESIDIDNVTIIETREQNRVAAEKIIGVKVGALYPVVPDDTTFKSGLSVGFNMKIEGRRFFLEFGACPLFPSSFRINDDKLSYGGINIELGGSYYLINNKYASPYIGVGVCPRILIFKLRGMGLVPYLQLGVMFMRHSSTRIYMDFRVGQNVFELEYEEYIWETDQDTHSSFRPTELGFEIGIGW